MLIILVASAGPRMVIPTEKGPGPRLLNDRAAAIVGAHPLALAGLAVPAGLTGRGQIVGLADSGLDSGRLSDLHPDLANLPGRMPKVVMLKSWSGRAVPDDPTGHGTHLAATIAGTGRASGGKFRGMAPEASLYFQAILDSKGEVSPPKNLEALFRPAYEAGVRIHVDGWGGGLNEYGNAASQIDAFIRQHPDFLAVFGAGNAGPSPGSLTAEANSKNALVVGASGNPRPALDPDSLDSLRPVSFSSRGPTEDGRLKPDLLAPGQAVVSARSRLVEGNFSSHPAYTVMGGTSMAAAVAGGALALLRQYLEEGKGVLRPSAALLKALLITGARVPPEGPGREGFGVLDLAAAVLALREGVIEFVDFRTGLGPGEAREWSLEVDSPGPLKVTLAWTDPAGKPGKAPALVNDLDLTVTTPDGRMLSGNHFLNRRGPDQLNNVEQVYLPDPLPGRYRIIVRAARVSQDAVPGVPGAQQDFALVWGQVPVTGVLASWEEGKRLLLADGRSLPWPKRGKVAVDDQVGPFEAGRLVAGAEVYWMRGAAYAFARTWQVTAGQVVPSRNGYVFMEADAKRREGGYLYHPLSDRVPLVNGRPAEDLGRLSPGGEIWASVNPSSQRLWQVRITQKETKGILVRVDPDNRRLWLLGQERPYRLAAAPVVSFLDRAEDVSLADAPFGAAEEADAGGLLPGLTVRLVLGTKEEVNFVAVERNLAVGRLVQTDPAVGKITLASGRTYQHLPGAPVERDGRKATLHDLRLGDHLTVLLLPGENRSVRIVANSRVTFGKVIYASLRPKTLYFVDELNRFRSLSMDGARIFRWGQAVDAAALTPGSWVRVVLGSEGREITRIDVAETVEERAGIFRSYDPPLAILRLADGSAYTVSPAALVTKEGYSLRPEDLSAGDRVQLSVLAAPPSGKVVFGLQASPAPGAASPRLTVRAVPQPWGVILAGTTSAGRLYLYRADGTRQPIPVASGGYFSLYVPLERAEETVRVVALDLAGGGLAAEKLILRPGMTGFSDLKGHWAEADALALARAGILGGYPDGTFRPAEPVIRAEVAALVVRLAGIAVVAGEAPRFRDSADIPSWARAAVAAAQKAKLVAGYPDGTFRGQAPVTRAELAAWIYRVLAASHVPLPANSVSAGPPDVVEVPAWARGAVMKVWSAGIFRGRGDGRFSPRAEVSRAEFAAALNRVVALLPSVTSSSAPQRPSEK